MQEQKSRVVEAVQRGAEWLDGKYPDWHNHIDMERLDTAFPIDCVGGQLDAWLFPNEYPDYERPLHNLPQNSYHSWDNFEYHGFAFEDDDCPEANAQWRYEIESRKNA